MPYKEFAPFHNMGALRSCTLPITKHTHSTIAQHSNSNLVHNQFSSNPESDQSGNTSWIQAFEQSHSK